MVKQWKGLAVKEWSELERSGTAMIGGVGRMYVEQVVVGLNHRYYAIVI